jgi:hypothetical protein
MTKMRHYLTQSLKGRDHLNQLILDGRIVLKWFLKIWWVHRGWFLVTTVMDLGFYKRRGMLWIVERLSASQGRFWSTEINYFSKIGILTLIFVENVHSILYGYCAEIHI